jgi:glycosyltransferase involved in cell wall biosynthesis
MAPPNQWRIPALEEARPPMPAYPDQPNPDPLGRVPLSARAVLDVGCGAGSLGQAFKRMNPSARVLGIEQDPEMARIAAERLDQVALTDIEQNPLPFNLNIPLDCLIYGDVLEHLRDPWRVLKIQAEALARHGTALICVPNVEHWSVVARLLGGGWDYEPSGIMDRTHLRWFTLRMMEQALRDARLVPADVTPRVFDAERHRDFITRLTPALQAFGIDPQEYARRSLPLQYVWRAVRDPAPRLHVVAHMLQPEGGVSHVRVVYPMAAIGTDPMVSTHTVAEGELPQLDPDTPKILILHRMVISGPGGLQLLRNLLAQNYVLITEFDDHPAFLSVLQRPDLHTFRGVHAVQTTTPALAGVLRQANPNVTIFPNAIRELPPVRNFTDPARLTVFFGGFNREPDWRPLLPALNSAAAAAGERLRFSIVHDQALFDALQTPHKSFTPTCDHATYMDLLSQAEISFMPLSDTEFNRAKSDLKFIESAACRTAALASPVVYAESIQDGKTGLLFRNAEELRQRLLRLVTNPDMARAMGDAARAWVAKHRMLAYQAADRVAWYRSLWNRRAELTAALYERMPELKPTDAAAN